MILRVQIQPPLDYSATLDLLAEWVGREVEVTAHSQAPGQPMSHSQVAMRGTLGPIEMVHNYIDTYAVSVAALRVGEGRSVYLSAGDFAHTTLVRDREHINIKLRHDVHIEVRRV
jgi:hypothetical protein